EFVGNNKSDEILNLIPSSVLLASLKSFFTFFKPSSVPSLVTTAPGLTTIACCLQENNDKLAHMANTPQLFFLSIVLNVYIIDLSTVNIRKKVQKHVPILSYIVTNLFLHINSFQCFPDLRNLLIQLPNHT